MLKPDKLLIKYDATFKEALEQLEKTHEKVLICIDEEQKLKGVLNDGDIRRAWLKDAVLSTSIGTFI